MDLKFKTLTLKIGGLCAKKREENHKSIPIYNIRYTQAITRSRAANSRKEVETKANQQTTTTTSECFNVCHQKYF